jgi:hypothetical protein
VPVLERCHAANNRVRLESPILQPVRHTDARRLAQSGATENDRYLPRERPKALGNRIRRDPKRAIGRVEPILTAAHIDQQCPVCDQLPRGEALDPQR